MFCIFRFSEHPEALSCLLLQLRKEKYDKKYNRNPLFFCFFCNISVSVSFQAKRRNGEDDLESSLPPRGPVHHQHSQTLGLQIRRDPGRTHKSPADQKQQPAPQETKVRTKLSVFMTQREKTEFCSGRSSVSVFVFSLRSSSSKLAQLTLEQILEHMDNLRLSLSNTKNNCKNTTLT